MCMMQKKNIPRLLSDVLQAYLLLLLEWRLAR